MRLIRRHDLEIESKGAYAAFRDGKPVDTDHWRCDAWGTVRPDDVVVRLRGKGLDNSDIVAMIQSGRPRSAYMLDKNDRIVLRPDWVDPPEPEPVFVEEPTAPEPFVPMGTRRKPLPAWLWPTLAAVGSGAGTLLLMELLK